MERYPEALADFTQAIELDPKDKLAIALRGETYLLLHQYADALRDCTAVIETDETDDWNYYLRALANIGLKQLENAKTDLAQAIQLAKQDYNSDSNNHRNTFNLALYYLVARQSEKAQRFYQDALTREAPTDRLKAAIQDLKDLLITLPNYPKAQEMQGFLASVLSLRQHRPVR
jgi:tetratricopeptide (TPR) repeat protein